MLVALNPTYEEEVNHVVRLTTASIQPEPNTKTSHGFLREKVSGIRPPCMDCLDLMNIHSPSFPPVRACIFDMDGLLINSEDIITISTNELLKRYGRPPFTSSIRAQLMGVPNSTNGDMFHDWAQLPVPRGQWAREHKAQMRLHFPHCEPLPGAEALLYALSHARGASTGCGIELALASSTKSDTYALKTSRERTRRLLQFFKPERRILGDDPRVRQGRGKPAPDIYLVALGALNATLEPGAEPVRPEECLVFEDSVAGVEAGRRAGMRVVWVPHADMAVEYEGRERQVLAARSGIFDIGDEWQLGQLDDGWAESISNLEHFNYDKYGIVVPS